MKPESLKQLAEYMGYNAVIYKSEVIVARGHVVDKYKLGHGEVYRPHTTNAEQCLELTEKLKISVEYFPQRGWSACAATSNCKIRSYIYGKTINEAVTAAAIAAINES